MSERLLPLTKLVKNEGNSYSFSSYDVVTVFDGMKLGEVSRLAVQPPWVAYQAVDHPQYGAGVKVVGRSRTRSEAAGLVVHAWMANIDEITAHEINDALIKGVQDAEDLAAQQLAINPDVPLVDGVVKGFVLDPSDAELKELRDYGEIIVRRQLSGEEELRLSSIESVTRRGRLFELELERRQRQIHRSMTPSRDHTGDEPAQEEIDWTARARQLAEEMGRAEANMMAAEESSWHRHLDDLEMRDRTVRAHNRLAVVKADRASYVCMIQSRAMNYQALLNEAHRRASLMAEEQG